MKTITEFRGISLLEAFKIRDGLFALKRAEAQKERAERAKNQPKAKIVITPTASAPAESTEPTAENPAQESETPAAPEVTETASVETPVVAAVEETQADAVVETTPAEVSSDPASAEATAVTPAAPEQPYRPVIIPRDVRDQQLRDEMKPLLAEKYSLEGDKLEQMISALEIVDFKRVKDLRRVTVLEVGEKENPPAGAIKRGNYYFVAEYLRSLDPPKRDRGPFRGKGGRGRGGKGRGPGRGGRGPRGGRGGSGGDGKPGTESGEGGGERKFFKKKRRDFRGPKPGTPETPSSGGGTPTST